MDNRIIVLCGFSASGKDSLARELENIGYNFIISTTTRPMRVGESEGNPYHFIDNESFQYLIDNDMLLEYREYNTLVDNIPAKWFYGVEKTAVIDNKKYVVVLDLVGLREFKELFGNRITSFFIDCDDEIRKHRCIKRGDFDEIEFNRRLLDDKKLFPRKVIENEIDFVVKSTTIKDNLEEILDKCFIKNKY